MIISKQAVFAISSIAILAQSTTTNAFTPATKSSIVTKKCTTMKQQQQQHGRFVPKTTTTTATTTNVQMAAGGDGGGGEDPIKITSVNSKEIFFDEKTGRFFETKLVSDENPLKSLDDDDDVSGPFKTNNPFQKPTGTFFDQFSKDKKSSASTPSPPTVVASSTSTPSPSLKEKVSSSSSSSSSSSPFSFLDSVLKPKEAEQPTKQTAARVVPPPPKPPTPTPVVASTPLMKKTGDSSTEKSSSPFSLLDNIFKPKEEEEKQKQQPVATKSEPVSTTPAAPAVPKVAPPKLSVPAAVSSSSSSSPFSFLDAIFKPKEEKEEKYEEVPAPVIVYDPVTISPDFRVAAAFFGSGLVLDQIPYIQWTLGPLVTLLGMLFIVQTFRVRFVFTENNELQIETVSNFFTGETKGGEESVGENIVVGGANRWACDKIVNYDFFPSIENKNNPVGPILVYFKEVQTPKEFWNDGPGKLANSGEGKVQGQVHFFPAVCNAEQIRDEFAKRGCGKL